MDRSPSTFQSSPTRKGGCYPASPSSSYPIRRFQSSPTRKGGCYQSFGPYMMLGAGCFNPHPPEKVGATCSDESAGRAGGPFQSSPTRKGGCYGRHSVASLRVGLVSILTHPKRWVLPPVKTRPLGFTRRFQSSPTRKGGCYMDDWMATGALSVFQSSPTRKGGCYLSGAYILIALWRVSILTHPKRWVLPPAPAFDWPHTCSFNPHPPEKVGATRYPLHRLLLRRRFNPHPPEKVGATPRWPPPSVTSSVSILTHPKRWVLPQSGHISRSGLGVFQSSPTRKGGCYHLWLSFHPSLLP